MTLAERMAAWERIRRGLRMPDETLPAFTAQNVRPPDEPEAPAFPLRALAPRRDDLRRLGHA